MRVREVLRASSDCAAGFVLILTMLLFAKAACAQGNQPLEPPVVYLHYDYMAGYDATIGANVSFAPPPEAVQMVVEAFRKHGVTLHIDPHHNVIPYREVVIPDWDPAWQHVSTSCKGNDAASFMALKAKYFTPHDNRPWHYAIFVHNAGLPDTLPNGSECPLDPLCGAHPNPNGAGLSEVPGYNFMVAIGTLVDLVLPLDNITPNMWASLLLHELGHNLGLMHGGVFGQNDQSCNPFKPNYVSVMNYSYAGNGIPYSTNGSPDWVQAIQAGHVRIDYSDETLPTLNEADLNEPAGVGSVLHANDLIAYSTFGGSGAAFASGPIDWNSDGSATETHAAVDIDGDDGYARQVLYGFNDWAYLGQFIRLPLYQSGQVHGAATH